MAGLGGTRGTFAPPRLGCMTRPTADFAHTAPSPKKVPTLMDSYDRCPCGSGKKIKFCCSDLLADFKTLEKMRTGDQLRAALQHVESIESADKPRAALLVNKIALLRDLERHDEAREATRWFIERFPDNPIAMSEAALEAAAEGDTRRSLDLIFSAMAQSPEVFHWQTYQAMSAVAEILAVSGDPRAARALWQLEIDLETGDNRPLSLLTQSCFSAAEPLMLKDEPYFDEGTADGPWKSRLDEAMTSLGRMVWPEAVAKLEKLVGDAPDLAAAWLNLAILRGWLADREGSAAAFERVASLDIPLEDAVEAKANAMLLADDPLGDKMDGLRMTFRVDNADELAGHFTTARQFEPIQVAPGMFDGEEVPPKAVFLVLDRPALGPGEGPTLDTMPHVVGQALLFGRQTDREARLVVSGVFSNERELIENLIVSAGNGQVTGPAEVETVASNSATVALLSPRWRAPISRNMKTLHDAIRRHIEQAVMEQWPRLELKSLGGQSVEQAARDPNQKIAVLAAVLVLENLVWRVGQSLDFNRLREKLGLPTLGPIDPKASPIDRLPLVRFHRLAVKELDDESLVRACNRAMGFGASEAARRLAAEVVERPGIAAEVKERTLVTMTHLASDAEQVMEFIEAGRSLAESVGKSSAAWDLCELRFRLTSGDAQQAKGVFDHLVSEHLREPGIADAIRQLMIDLGLVDEQGRWLGRREGAPNELDEPYSESLDQPFAEPSAEPSSGLWTPDGERASGETPKLWTPDMG
ncbi:MAG: hypothetical protein GX621_19355 [Pirellulaceae bacterium]|nr:hypothetical protein [Pirellulaceae bacterium]